MKCAVHTDVDATGYCRNCGKALCPACARDVHGVLYCEPCLAELVNKPATPPAGSPSPNTAGALGLIPGLGAVYNGEYSRALMQLAIFVGLILLANANAPDVITVLAILGAIGFCLFTAIDAHRRARARQVSSPIAPEPSGSEKPIGPFILIGLGILLLLNEFHVIPWDALDKLWPAVLIVLGVVLLWRRMAHQGS